MSRKAETAARNIEICDGLPWRRWRGRLYGDYPTAAEYAGAPEGTIKNWVSAGVLRAYGRGNTKRRFVAKDELDTLLVGEEAA